jgi:hypothetical protein
MRTRRQATIEDLRLAIECLPRDTRIAMLAGIRANPIIVGAYSTEEGICPMLAAHRAGGRTNLIAFADAWDRFALRRKRSDKPRPATDRELRVLEAHLQASLLDPAQDLASAIAEHRALLAARAVEATPEEPIADRRCRPRLREWSRTRNHVASSRPPRRTRA